MNRNIVELIGDTVNKLAKSAKPKKYVVFCCENYSPINGSLYTVQYVTEEELKQFIEKYHARDIYIFKPEDVIKYNIDITIEEVNDDERY